MLVRASAVFDYCNTLAYFLVVALGAQAVVFALERDRYWRQLTAVSAAASLWALWQTYSRGAWLALGCGCAVGALVWVARNGVARRRGLAVVVLAVGVAAIAIGFGARREMPTQTAVRQPADVVTPFPGGIAEADGRDTLATRVLLWRAAWSLFCESPVCGVGVDRFRFMYYDHLPRVNFDLFAGQGLYQPHSLVLTVLAGQGLIGLAAFAGFVTALVLVIRRRLRGPLPVPTVTVLGLVAALAVANVYDAVMFDSYVNVLLVTLVLALLSADGWQDAAPVD
jgi:O-antigen ligase